MLVGEKKFACQSCIKGHRATTCKHSDRPLFEVKKKGRPPTQCQHCRDLRKTKSVHVRCDCEGKVNQDGQNRIPDLPHGIKDLVSPSESGCKTCQCKFGKDCTCVGLVHQDGHAQSSPTKPKPDSLAINPDLSHLDEETSKLLEWFMQNAANPPVPNHASDASATSSDNLFDLPPSQEQTHELSHHGTRRVSHHSHHAYTPYEIPNMLIPAHSHPALPSPPSNLYGVPIPMPPLNTNVHPFEFPTTLTPLNTPVEASPALATPFGVPDPSLNLQNMICQFFGACICGNCSMGSSQPPSETALSLCPEQCGTCPTCMAALGMGGSEVVVRGAALLGNGIMESNGQYFDIEQWLRDGATAGWVDAPLPTGEPNWLDVAAAEGQDVASQSQSTVATFHGLKPRTAPQESYQF